MLDSGAAVSVVRLDTLDENWLSQIRQSPGNAIGPDGLPLEVMGEVEVPISLGEFQACKAQFYRCAVPDYKLYTGS